MTLDELFKKSKAARLMKAIDDELKRICRSEEITRYAGAAKSPILRTLLEVMDRIKELHEYHRVDIHPEPITRCRPCQVLKALAKLREIEKREK